MLKNYIPNPILKAENDIKTFEHQSSQLQNLEDFETHLANSSFLLPEVLAPHLGLPFKKAKKHTLNITEATGESL